MQEHEPLTGKEILSLKDELVARWKRLPPEHQATLALVLVRDVSQGEWGAWFQEAMRLQESAPADPASSSLLVTFSFTRDDLRAANFGEAEIAQLTDDDLAIIARTVRDHVAHDNFFVELEYVTEVYLGEKRRKGCSHTQDYGNPGIR